MYMGQKPGGSKVKRNCCFCFCGLFLVWFGFSFPHSHTPLRPREKQNTKEISPRPLLSYFAQWLGRETTEAMWLSVVGIWLLLGVGALCRDVLAHLLFLVT